MRRFFKRLAVTAAVTLALVLALELVLRALEPGPFSFYDRSPYLTDHVLRHKHKTDFRGHWEGTWFDLNSLGMRGPEIPVDKPAEEYRVVALGDSCTFGKSVTEAETWPRQLETLLAEHAPADRTVRVANLGVNGFAGHEYHEMYFRLGRDLDPDLVVVGYNLNDFPNVIFEVDQRVYKRRKLRQMLSQGLRDKLGRTALYRFVRAAFYEVRKEEDWANAERFARETARAGQDPEVWAQQEGYLQEIVTAARERGAEVAVLLFPYESQVYLDSYDTTPIELMQELCQRLDVPFVDLAEPFRNYAHAVEGEPRRLFVWGDRYHPTGEGYGLIARRLVDVITERGWLAEDR